MTASSHRYIMTNQEPTVISAPQVAYEVAMRRLDEQMRQIDAIDNKIGFVLTAASAIIAVFAGFAAVTVKPEHEPSLAVGLAFMVLAGSIFVLAVVSGLQALRFYEWQVQPNWDDLLEYSGRYPEHVLQRWVAEACVASLKANTQLLDRKLSYGGHAMRFLLTEALAAAVGLLALILANAL